MNAVIDKNDTISIVSNGTYASDICIDPLVRLKAEKILLDQSNDQQLSTINEENHKIQQLDE